MADLTKTDKAWADILTAHPEIEAVTASGDIYEIEASEIKRFREPRLMTKFDTSANVPPTLKKLHLDVLPNSRHSYVLGKFNLYEPFPLDMDKKKSAHITLPNFETLRIESLTSESNAINALIVSKTLESFLEESELFETFNGRMGTNDFNFEVSLHDGTLSEIEVHAAQLEIDGGFESDNSIVIMEAKNVFHKDFNIRQLYFPYRKYLEVVHKPIRLVFSQYTNLTYYLHEYEFEDYHNFSSIKHLRTGAYTFEDTAVTASDLIRVWHDTPVKTDDNQNKSNTPFIQADRFEIVLALLEQIASFEEGMPTSEIANFIGYEYRQANYYPSAGDYLGLFDRTKRGRVCLTPLAKTTLTLSHRDRQLVYAGLMFEHEIFHRLFPLTYESGTLPSWKEVLKVMRELNVCNTDSATGRRRAQSVVSWLKWLMLLPEDDL